MHVTPVDTLPHHRTLPVLMAAALAVVLAVASFVVVDEVTSSSDRASGRTSPAAVTSGATADGTFLDPGVFDRALAGAIARGPLVPSPAFTEGVGFDQLVADELTRMGLASR